MRDKFILIDHIISFQNIYENKSFNEIIFQGTLQSLLLDFQIISQPSFVQTEKDLNIHQKYILGVLTNTYQLIKIAKTEDEVKIANFLFQNLVTLSPCEKIIKKFPFSKFDIPNK